MQEVIKIVCSDCTKPTNKNPGVSVYWTTKNKKTTPDKLQKKKYCSYCKSHTLHVEKK